MRVLTSGISTSILVVALTFGAARPCRGQAQASSPIGAQSAASQGAEVQAVRGEVERLRKELEALEARLAALEGKAPGAPAEAAAAPQPPTPTAPAAPQAPATAAVPAGAAGQGGPEGALPVYGGTAALSKVFNPDMAVIGDFLGAAGKNRIDSTAPLEMHEAETSFQAVVDPYARADVFIAFSPEGVEIEEGFLTFTSLPGGLLAKVGKMRSSFGKVNQMHNHVLPWADRPLVTTNLVGGEEGISDSGISVSRLILNPLIFLEATGEIYRGDSAVFASHSRSDLTYVGRLRGYRDVTEATNLDVGTSVAYGHNTAGTDTTTRLIGVDATFRYRPLRRAIYRRFAGRTELIWSRREAEVSIGPPVASAFGYYASGEYQFARRWFAGARYDHSERAVDPLLKDKGGSLLLTYWPSEFSQIRGQYRRTSYAEGTVANELLFQFIFSIGAHGAHTF